MDATVQRVSARTSVLVFPGYNASDRSTVVLRAAVAAGGHEVHGWGMGRNEGPSDRTKAGLVARLTELSERRDQPVALIGWSLGGAYAHWLARSMPELVRSVVTLGSPLNRDGTPPALMMPTTSVYSRNDRIVHWQTSLLDEATARHENIEVRSLHAGLGFDPAVLWVIGDRLRRSPGRWKPFESPVWLRPAFPNSAAIQG